MAGYVASKKSISIKCAEFHKVRRGLSFLEKRAPSPHPLADWLFETDGVNLFVRELGGLINISQDGQVEMEEVVSQ